MTLSHTNSALRIVKRFLASSRPEQIIDFNDTRYFINLILAGRGWGKTHTGSNNTLRYIFSNPNHNVSIVAPTNRDLEETCLWNPQCGILSLVEQEDPSLIIERDSKYNTYKFFNGALLRCYTSESFQRLRGPQHHYVWYDEYAASQYPEETLDMILFGLRLGVNPKLVMTTTPKPIPSIRNLIKQSDVKVVKGTTYDNKANLSAKFIEIIEKKYEGTRLGRQELHGIVLDDIQGALWQLSWIENYRSHFKTLEELEKTRKITRKVLAIDPAITNKEDSDLTGIVVVAEELTWDLNNDYHVIADHSLIASPNEWANVVKNVFAIYDCDAVVVEVNQGGDMVKTILRNSGFTGMIYEVRASKSKFARAEPVAALYEQGRVHHLSSVDLKDLELQLVEYVPLLADKSPDRLDALVWGISHFIGEDNLNAQLMQQIDFKKLGRKI